MRSQSMTLNVDTGCAAQGKGSGTFQQTENEPDPGRKGDRHHSEMEPVPSPAQILEESGNSLMSLPKVGGALHMIPRAC